MGLWPLLSSLLALTYLATVTAEPFGVLLVLPEYPTNKFMSKAEQATQAFTDNRFASITVVVKQRIYNNGTMCHALYRMVRTVIEDSPDTYVFIFPTGRNNEGGEPGPYFCWDEWWPFFSSRVIFVAPVSEYKDSLGKVDFQYGNGEQLKATNWRQMAFQLYKLYANYANFPIDDEDYPRLLSLIEEVKPCPTTPTEMPTTTEATITATTSTSIDETPMHAAVLRANRGSFDEDRSNEEKESEKRNRRLAMMLIGFCSTCLMVTAFAIRNHYYKMKGEADKKREKKDSTAEDNVNTAKVCAKKGSRRKD